MRRSLGVAVITVAGLFVLDRVSRTLAFAHPPGDLIPHVLRSLPTQNTGVAFGLPLPGAILPVALTVLMVCVAFIGWHAYRHQQVFVWWAALMVFAGATSNVLDRLHLAYVRDFLTFTFWPTTANLGDWLITVGALFLLISALRLPSREP